MRWFFSRVWNCARNNRKFHSSSRVFEGEKQKTENYSEYVNQIVLSPFQKRLFVWSGKYRRIQDVPERVSYSALSNVRSICRIKLSNYLMILTTIMCFIVISQAKKSAETNQPLPGKDIVAEYRKFKEENKGKESGVS
ncbi:UNVERIFIED_CONTAM: hypothetical protein PYX00_002383 [Menopon gallinae]|uniref:Uncharacterized protein n=1 Tax=Menopon gallinae TaxID=328185 RepID=A0AAW2IHW9_9NEOP